MPQMGLLWLHVSGLDSVSLTADWDLSPIGCGPASLNTLVRECVVAQINLGCVWKEGGRGHISFVAEEFDY